MHNHLQICFSGQLKEKKGRWKFLKRWKTRYFTLSGSAITYNKKDMVRAWMFSYSVFLKYLCQISIYIKWYRVPTVMEKFVVMESHAKSKKYQKSWKSKNFTPVGV